MSEYPNELIRKRHLPDGTEVTIRPIRPEDSVMEQEFARHLSEDSRYCRFMGHVAELPEKKLRYFTDVDYERHMALVATVARDGKELEIGVARYVATAQPNSCEFAVTVDDAWQGTGIAGLLMLALIDSARAHGYRTMEGKVLRTNFKMLKFARQLGFVARRDPEDGDTVTVVKPL
ncbi:MAG: GNAT family N-acetyltransferase [Betaproteobacteria bacterium]|nr:GNAT family N-acetyltransferase [Betaproteobacteria bacterium]